MYPIVNRPYAGINSRVPVLVELEGAYLCTQSAQAAYTHACGEYHKLLGSADISYWVGEINRAGKDEVRLGQLSRRRSEHLLSFAAAELAREVARRWFEFTQTRLKAAMLVSRKYHDGLTNQDHAQWVGPIIQNNCVAAGWLLSVPVKGADFAPACDGYRMRCKTTKIMRNAYTDLKSALSKHSRTKCDVDTIGLFIGSTLGTLYPTTFIEPQPSGRRDVDVTELRDLVAIQPPQYTDESGVTFVGTDYEHFTGPQQLTVVRGFEMAHNPVRAAAYLLPLLLEDLRVAVDNAFAAMAVYKNGEKGRLNEPQHMERLVDYVLDGGAGSEAAGKAASEREMAQQHHNRCRYESARVALKAALIAAEVARWKVTECIFALTTKDKIDANLESHLPNDGALWAPDRMCGKQLEARAAMVNILAADSAVRQAARQIKTWHEELVNDLSKGRAGTTLDEEFERVFEAMKTKPDEDEE